jgi:hypothetical protein
MQNESFREIVQSGDMALIAAIEELSRAASLEDVSDLSRTDALAEVPDIIAHEEWGNISALAAEVPIGEVADAAMDGTLSAIAEIVRDEKGFTAFGDLIRENDLIKIVNLAADRPEGEDFSTFDVIKEIFEKDLEDEFQEFVEAIPEDETGPDAPRDDAWIKRKVADGFGRTPVADRVADLYRAGYLGAVRDLYRTGFMERTEALYRAGYLDNAAKMARTEGSLERVDRMLRTEGSSWRGSPVPPVPWSVPSPMPEATASSSWRLSNASVPRRPSATWPGRDTWSGWTALPGPKDSPA